MANRISTPVYIYNADLIDQALEIIKSNFVSRIPFPVRIRYAVKANTNQAVLALLSQRGIGAEVVSGGELWRALKAGISSNSIVFSGVGKRPDEIELALDHNIEQVSIESVEELQFLANLSRPANLCIRVSPDIAAATHDKITTGRWHDKFGIPVSQIPRVFKILQESPFLNFLGFSLHLGSQISDIQTFRRAFKLLNELRRQVSGSFTVKRLDLGGGFSVPYHEDQKAFDWLGYAQAVQDEFKNFEGDLVIEPGRFLVANAGILLTKILYIKKVDRKTFVVVDAGMNDMARSALYGVSHKIIAVEKINDPEAQRVDVVGPVCESSDIFAKDIMLPSSLAVGDLLAIMTVGAYGASLSSMYNSRSLIPEVLIANQRPYVVREPVSVQQLASFETYRELV